MLSPGGCHAELDSASLRGRIISASSFLNLRTLRTQNKPPFSLCAFLL